MHVRRYANPSVISSLPVALRELHSQTDSHEADKTHSALAVVVELAFDKLEDEGGLADC
jgi:hypothetical protein